MNLPSQRQSTAERAQYLYSIYNNIKNLKMKTLGIILLVIGGIMMIFTGFNITTRKKVVDLGPVEINKEEKTPIYWSPVTGGILLAAGVLVLVVGKRK
jgi:hypothetical protein